MPDPGSNTVPAELARLGEDIRDLLVRADALGLFYVAIHLCTALETLEAEAADQSALAAANDPFSAS